ncbi:MAG: methionine ABC transporter ATP-binding protein, partial [Actinobacteria bacterium]|nr:methionine ABC transporter ATP-binding protein [Actinomycetota bacterium]
MSKLLEVSNLSVLIAEDQRVLVNDVSFSIEPGEAVG